MKQISIIAATFSGNRGAEAMLCSTIARLRDRFPESIFNVYSYYPNDDRLIIRDSKINIYNAAPLVLVFKIFLLSIPVWFCRLLKLNILTKYLPRSLRSLSSSDVLIDLAGVSFIDGREKFIPYNILSILPAVIMGIPVVKFSQAMGPFKSKINRISANYLLKKCDAVFARGEITEEYLQSLNLKSSISHSAADVAFLHESKDGLTHENEKYVSSIVSKLKKLKKKDRMIIGLCPSSLIAQKSRKSGWDYIGFLQDTVKLLNEKGYSVIMFPNATRDYDMAHLRNNDLPVILSVMKNISGSENIYVDRNINSVSIKSLISMCDVTVVSRFHAMVGSLSLKIPVMVLGWSHKYLEVMGQFGQEKYVFDYKKSDRDYLWLKMFDLIDKRKKESLKIGNRLNTVKKSSYSQIDYVIRLLNK